MPLKNQIKGLAIEMAQPWTPELELSQSSSQNNSEMELQASRFVSAQNQMRKNPQSFIPELKEQLSKFKGNVLNGIMYQEGPSAWNELINFLESAKPIDDLKFDKEGMTYACDDLVNQQGPTGQTGHTAPDGSSPFTRLDKYGTWESTAGENIAYGTLDGRQSLIQLMVDDGVPSRGHRKNIMNPAFKVTGVDIGEHKKYRFMTCATYAGGYKSNGKKPLNANSATTEPTTTESTTTEPKTAKPTTTEPTTTEPKTTEPKAAKPTTTEPTTTEPTGIRQFIVGGGPNRRGSCRGGSCPHRRGSCRGGSCPHRRGSCKGDSCPHRRGSCPHRRGNISKKNRTQNIRTMKFSYEDMLQLYMDLADMGFFSQTKVTPMHTHMPPTENNMPPAEHMPPTENNMPATGTHMPPTENNMPPAQGAMGKDTNKTGNTTNMK